LEGFAMNMLTTNRSRLGLAAAAISTAAVICAAISSATGALAAPEVTQGNYHGPARQARPAALPREANNRAPAGAPARAATAPTSVPGATVTGHYSLAASAFAPDGLHDTTEDYFNAWDPATLSNQDSGRCFNAGLSLPDKAVLKTVTVYYTESTTDMYFEINEQDLAAHTATDAVSLDTPTAATPTYASDTVDFAKGSKVNMADDAYSAGVCPNGSATFTGFTITYTLPGS
jgi:hypothetical protein